MKNRFVCILILLLIISGGAVFGGGQSEAAPAEPPAGGGPVIDIPYGPTDGKKAADYQFGFSFGGINPYADPVEPAATQAEKELGITKHMIISTRRNGTRMSRTSFWMRLLQADARGSR